MKRIISTVILVVALLAFAMQGYSDTTNTWGGLNAVVLTASNLSASTEVVFDLQRTVTNLKFFVTGPVGATAAAAGIFIKPRKVVEQLGISNAIIWVCASISNTTYVSVNPPSNKGSFWIKTTNQAVKMTYVLSAE
jgi:hypothetical protein